MPEGLPADPNPAEKSRTEAHHRPSGVPPARSEVLHEVMIQLNDDGCDERLVFAPLWTAWRSSRP